MIEELKYKVGDKFLVEVCVASLEDRSYPYELVVSKTDDFISHFSEDELDKIVVKFLPKPKIRQFVMDWYENCKDTYPYIGDYFDNASPNVKQWLSEDVRNEHALATLIAYGPEAVEVEKEKMYRVKIKGTAQVLAKRGNSYLFEIPNPYDKDGEIYSLTNQKLIEAGFEGVFDNPMFEIEEVE